jgi:hypothetical protein
MSATDTFIVSGQVQLPDYAPGESVLIETDNSDTVQVLPVSTQSVHRFLYSTNVPMFEVWMVPPQAMVTGTYCVLGNWQAQRPPLESRTSTTPLPAVVLNYFDNSAGDLDGTSGVFTASTSGTYRHSMTIRVNDLNSNTGSYGAFVRVNGVRSLGDFFFNTGDTGFHEYHHFSTEMWHNAGDEIAFQALVNSEDGANGVFARWAVVRASAMIPVV